MSAHALLNLLRNWGKMIKCKACRAFYHFFASSLINSIRSTNVRLYLSYDIKIILNLIFGVKTFGFFLPYA